VADTTDEDEDEEELELVEKMYERTVYNLHTF
jgi:hypothetical protein